MAIDSAIVTTIAGVLVGIVAMSGIDGNHVSQGIFTLPEFTGPVIWTALLVDLVYAPTMIVVSGGRTIGKALMGLRVVTTDGLPVSWRRAAVREVLLKDFLGASLGLLVPLPIALFVLWAVVGLADPLWAFGNPRRRTLHDYLVETRVVRTEKRAEGARSRRGRL